jgi:dynein heavy chain
MIAKIDQLLQQWPQPFNDLEVERCLAVLEHGKTSGGGGSSASSATTPSVSGSVTPSVFSSSAASSSSSHAAAAAAATTIEDLSAKNPYHVFLQQEINRLQLVLVQVRAHLKNVRLAMTGQIMLSATLYAVLAALYRDMVPAAWLRRTWASHASLAEWFRGMIASHAQLHAWLHHGAPRVFSIAGMFNPKGFLTAVKQFTARSHKQWALDDVDMMATLTKMADAKAVRVRPSDGVLIHGLLLDGACWDRKRQKLCEAPVGVLQQPLPVMHVTARNLVQKNPFGYECPVYRLAQRTDLNFIFNVNLACAFSAAQCARNGIAIICSK